VSTTARIAAGSSRGTESSGTARSSVAIETRALVKRFGDLAAVDDVSLAVERGAVFGLLGPDGAGKSTLITMLATVQRPTSGDALIEGFSVVDDPDAIKPHVGYMSQRFSMYPDLTVNENLEFFSRLRGVPRRLRRERAPRLLAQMGMERFGDRLADKLSGGMKQKLMLASTLMTEPDVLLLDEPTTGVDPVSRREFWRIIATLHRAVKTVLVATPYMDEAERCTHVAFMDAGRITEQGTPAQIKSRVPGSVIELAVDPQRDAVAALSAMTGVTSANVLGESVRALVAHGGPRPDELADALERAGMRVLRAREVPVDMEAAFAYLAEAANASAKPDALEEARR
jgi:ABC-2 type transport system ATP-binding protein